MDEQEILDTNLPPKRWAGYLMLGTGTGVLLTNDKSVSLEMDIWDTHEFVSCTELECVTDDLDNSEEREGSDDLGGENLSGRSAERDATAAAAAATKGLWKIPETEAMMMMGDSLTISHTNSRVLQDFPLM